MKTLKEIDPDGWVLLTDEAKQHVLALEFIRDAYQTELDPVVRDMIATDIDHMKTRCTVCGAPLPCIVIESPVIPVSLPFKEVRRFWRLTIR